MTTENEKKEVPTSTSQIDKAKLAEMMYQRKDIEQMKRELDVKINNYHKKMVELFGDKRVDFEDIILELIGEK